MPDRKQIQIKVTLPPHLYAALRQEAKDAAVTMADLVRLALINRYKAQEVGLGFGSDGDLRRLIQAYKQGLITAKELADRLIIEAGRRFTDKSGEGGEQC